MIIDGNRILTNAHVVNYASQVYVQADQTTDHVPAKVWAIAPSIDLAIIQAENPSFFDQRPASAAGRRHSGAEADGERVRISDGRRAAFRDPRRGVAD